MALGLCCGNQLLTSRIGRKTQNVVLVWTNLIGPGPGAEIGTRSEGIQTVIPKNGAISRANQGRKRQ
jgi:hypothetical protein